MSGEVLLQSTSVDVTFSAYLASDHVSPATGKTIAVTISKNKGAFGNPSAGATNATEIANGVYYVNFSATDTATLGPLVLRGAVATVDDVIVHYRVRKATTGDLTGLADAVPGAASGLTICGSNAATIFATLTSTGAFTVNGVSAISQSGDSYARIGAPAGASVSADIAALPAGVLTAATVAPIAADAKKMNGSTINGTGTSGDLWRGE